MTYDSATGRKWLTVAQLKELLSVLDDNLVVMPNKVGNMVFMADPLASGEGFIDFNEPMVVFFDEPYSYALDINGKAQREYLDEDSLI